MGRGLHQHRLLLLFSAPLRWRSARGNWRCTALSPWRMSPWPVIVASGLDCAATADRTRSKGGIQACGAAHATGGDIFGSGELLAKVSMVRKMQG